MKFILSFTFLSFSYLAFSQDISTKVPKQGQVVQQGIAYFFKDIPGYLVANLLYQVGMDDWHFFVHEHETRFASSPFRVFNGVANRRTPQQEFHFPFVNSKSSFFEVVELEYGVCSGMTSMLRKMNLLAYFDTKNIFKQNVPAKTNQEQWLKFYIEKLNEVAALKPVLIPNFKNLEEFASIPEIRFYLKKLILNQWLNNNVSIKGLIQLAGVRRVFSVEKAEKLFSVLTKRLSLNYNPIVYLAKPNDQLFSADQWIHVLQVVNVSQKDSQGAYTIDLWDVNEEMASEAVKQVIITADGRAFWAGDELSDIQLMPSDDLEMAQIVTHKLAWCTQSQKYIDLCMGRLKI